jgi:hypothetical protein
MYYKICPKGYVSKQVLNENGFPTCKQKCEANLCYHQRKRSQRKNQKDIKRKLE